jgi:hypothetical protein
MNAGILAQLANFHRTGLSVNFHHTGRLRGFPWFWILSDFLVSVNCVTTSATEMPEIAGVVAECFAGIAG